MHDRSDGAVTILGTRGGRGALLGTAAFVLVAICLVFGAVMTAWHGDVGKALGASGQRLATAVAQSIDRNVELLDLSMRGVAQQWGEKDIRQLSPNLRDKVLFDKAMLAPGFGMILVIDRVGAIVAGSNVVWSPETRLDDRDYFRVHLTSTDVGLFVSKPFVSRITGRRNVALSRRIQDDSGAFAGVVLGTIDLDYLSKLYAGLTLGTDSAVALLRMDGTVIAREPPMPTSGREFVGDEDAFRTMRSAQAGTIEGLSPFDGKPRLTSFNRVGTLPLIQTVEVGEEGAFAGWWRRAAAVAGLLAILCLSVLGLCLALTLELGRRAAAEGALARLAGTDPLTGLANRRSFDAAVAAEWSAAAANREAVSFLMIDADVFKSYNDLFGHQAGDEVLRRVAACLEASAREWGGVVCRWGGEEFALFIRGLGEESAVAVGDELCRKVRGLRLAHSGGIGGVVTISVGVTSDLPSPDTLPGALLAGADGALYCAKAEGRDCSRARPRVRPAPARDARLSSVA